MAAPDSPEPSAQRRSGSWKGRFRVVDEDVEGLANSIPSRSTINFECAYRMYNGRVYAKCLRMVGNEADAEDLTQEVFLHVFRKMDSFRGEICV